MSFRIWRSFRSKGPTAYSLQQPTRQCRSINFFYSSFEFPFTFPPITSHSASQRCKRLNWTSKKSELLLEGEVQKKKYEEFQTEILRVRRMKRGDRLTARGTQKWKLRRRWKMWEIKKSILCSLGAENGEWTGRDESMKLHKRWSLLPLFFFQRREGLLWLWVAWDLFSRLNLTSS